MMKVGTVFLGLMSMAVLLLPALPAPAQEPRTRPQLLDEVYEGYEPVFDKAQPTALMKTSLQPTFYNRAVVVTDTRADALVREGIKREAEGDYFEAMRHYQQVIDRYPESMIQVSRFGVFVPAVQYVQQRLLLMPPKSLSYYRTMHDAEAREIYVRARARYSTAGLHDVANFYRASSYGERALFDLGSRALDIGEYEEAAAYFEQIREWHKVSGLDPAEVIFRLAYASRRLGREKECAEILKDPKASGISRDRLAALGQLKPDARYAGGDYEQRKNPKFICFSDFACFEPLENSLSSDASQWRIELPKAAGMSQDDEPSGGEVLPFHRPWVVNNSLYYKHYNRIYCRSLVTGELRWAFELGSVERDVRRLSVWHRGRGTPIITAWYSDQDILVDDGLVFANIRVPGSRESLVALDAVTGERRWAVGPMNPAEEEDLRTRYDAAPALGRFAVFAPWSYDEGEGDDHLYSSVGLTSFDKETGQILWRRELCRLSPTATTQSRQGIRVLSATPVVQEGTLYHVTNAGTVAALDAESGMVHWIIRYPHVWNISLSMLQAESFDAHDEVSLGSDAPGTGPHFSNQSPLLRGDRLYVTPADSDHLLCLDRRTGKVLWSLPSSEYQYLVGFTREGHLILAGSYGGVWDTANCRIEIRDPDSGNLLWRFVPAYRATWRGPRHEPGVEKTMRLLCRPTLTSDDRLYFSTFAAPPEGSGYHGSRFPVFGEWCLSLKDRRLLDYRVYYPPNYRDFIEAYMRGTIRDQKDYLEWVDLVAPEDVNASFPYDPVCRLPFTFHGVPYEITTSGDRMWAQFDRDRLEQAVAQGKTTRELFTRAEILLARGRKREATTLFEECKKHVRLEERRFLQEIDRELYRLYYMQAWEALLAGENGKFHENALQMARTASTSGEEIQSLLVLAESFERRGQVESAVKSLRSIIRHYARTIHAVPSILLGRNAGEEEFLGKAMGLAAEKKPADMERELSIAEKSAVKALPAFFSAAASADLDVKLDADELAVLLLNGLLDRNPSNRAELETAAAKELGTGSLAMRAYVMKSYPGTEAAQKTLDDLFAEAAGMESGPRQKRLWELKDWADRLSLKVPADVVRAALISPRPVRETRFPADFVERSNSFDDAQRTHRLLLTCRGAGDPDQLFVGGRSKKRLDNKFSLECWDIGAWKRKWEVHDIRLKGKGDEKGFEEVFLSSGRVITHGKFDVLAFEAETGKEQWHVEVPFDFDLKAADLVGDLLVLSGATHTLALQVSTGSAVWSVAESGNPYCPPFLREGVLISVRREPFSVTFRRLGTGVLLRSLAMPDLNLETKHPILAEDISGGAIKAGTATDALPIAFDGDLLVLTDGVYYVAMDTKAMAIRWKRRIDNIDILGGPPPIRFYLKGDHLLVLKRDFNVPALHLLDSRTGALRWSKTGKDTLYSILFDETGNTLYGLAPPESTRYSAVVKELETASGKEVRTWEWTGFQNLPDAVIAARFPAGKLVLQAIHGERMDFLALDLPNNRPIFRIGVKASGKFAEPGGKSLVVQGPNLLLMNSEQMTAGVPKPEKK